MMGAHAVGVAATASRAMRGMIVFIVHNGDSVKTMATTLWLACCAPEIMN